MNDPSTDNEVRGSTRAQHGLIVEIPSKLKEAVEAFVACAPQLKSNGVESQAHLHFYQIQCGPLRGSHRSREADKQMNVEDMQQSDRSDVVLVLCTGEGDQTENLRQAFFYASESDGNCNL